MEPSAEVIPFLSDDSSLAALYANGVRPKHFFTVEMQQLVSYAEDYFITHGGMSHAPTEDMLREEFSYYDEMPRGCGGFTPQYVAEKLIDEFVVNTASNSLSGLIDDLKGGKRDEIVDDVKNLSNYLMEGVSEGSDKVDFDSSVDAITKIAEESFDIPGVPLPIQEMQDYTSGIKPGELFVLAAASGTGKTLYACLNALSAKKSGWNVYFATLEMSTQDICRRLELITARDVSPANYMAGIADDSDMERMRHAREKIASYPGKLVIEKPPYHDCSMQSLISRAKMNGCDFIIIDQLQFVSMPEGYRNKWEAVEESIYIAKRSISNSPDGIQLPMLLLVQMNREGAKMANAGGMGTMSDIAMSSNIERVADAVWTIARKDEATMKIASLKTRRYGARGWELDWDFGNTCRFGAKHDLNGRVIEMDQW